MRNGKLSFTWILLDEDDQVLLEGSEFAEVGADGRFERVTSFAGRPQVDRDPARAPAPGAADSL